jgi:N-acetylneuraminic acid mutarotase
VGLGVGVVNGILYAVGGEIIHVGAGGYREFLSAVEAYNPSTNSWSSKAPLPTPRSGVSVGVVDGILYALGGDSSEIGRTEWNRPLLKLDTVDAYDPVRNTWTAKAAMPTRRYAYGVGVAKGTLYVVGGSAGTETGLLEAYDPIKNRWAVKAPMPTPRAIPGVGIVNGILYAVGGLCCGCWEPADKILGAVEAYDPTTNTWTAKAPMLTPRAGVAVGVANQVLYAVGGFSKSMDYKGADVVEAYDPIRNVWTTKAQLPGNRNGVALGSVKGILYAVGGVIWVPVRTDSPDYGICGIPPCHRSLVDPITYAFKAVP